MIETHLAIPYLREIVIFLVAAGVMIPLLQRYHINPILGFLITGMVIGPYGLGRASGDFAWLRYFVISDSQEVKILAELGIVFLLFMIGLELSISRLIRLRKLVFGLGSMQVLLTAIVVGGIAFLFKNSVMASVLLGTSMALSSTAIVMQWISQRRAIHSSSGRVSFSILLFQDLAVVPILFLISIFANASIPDIEPDIGTHFSWILIKGLATIVAIITAGRWLLRPLFRHVGKLNSPEFFLAISLLTIIGTSAITGYMGLSMALGGFLAGLVLAETEYRTQIESTIEPFKGLLMGLFFISIGMGIDHRAILHDPVWIFLSVIGLLMIKTCIAYSACRLFKLSHDISLSTAMLLSQGGEFALLVVGLSVTAKLIPSDTAQFMMIVVGLTMLLTPIIAFLANCIYPESFMTEKHLDHHLHDH